MAFQFVNSTPDNPEFSAETRRSIRSQAMRDYRRRQRDDSHDLTSSPEPTTPSSTASPTLSPQSHTREASQRRTSSSRSLGVQLDLLRRHSSGTSSDNPPLAHSRGASRGKRRSPQLRHESDPSQKTQRRRRGTEGPRAQHGVFSQFMVNLPRRTMPSTHGEDVDTQMSTAQLEQMLRICEEYNTWLMPSTSVNAPGEDEPRTYDSKNSQLLLYALCLKSVGHLEAVRSREVWGENALLKMSVLVSLNKQLKDSSKALEDDTIGALACLASYELSQGSNEAAMHLTGLQQIINLRGGTREMGKTAGLSMLLEILDLTHAVYFRASPMYTTVEPSQPSSMQEAPAPTSRSMSGQGELDQDMLDDISKFILSVPDLAAMSERLPAGPEAPLRQVATPCTSDSEIEWWQTQLSEATRKADAGGGHAGIAFACNIAEQLLLLNTCPIQPHPLQTQTKRTELFDVVRDVPDEVWDAVSRVHLTVLLTALTASASSSNNPDSSAQAQRSWFLSHLTRRLYQTSAEDWPSVKGTILRFIEMQAAARQSQEPRSVMTMLEGVDMEIVVDTDEADELVSRFAH